MKKLACLFGLLLGYAHAATFYFSQSGSGLADGSSSGNAATLATANARTNSPDDILIIVGTITSTITVHDSGTAGHQITYLYSTGAKSSSAVWGTSTGAAIYAAGKSYITIDGGSNGIIENTANGTLLANQSTTCGIFCETSGVHWIVQNITVQNMYQRTPGSSTDTNGGGTLGFRGISMNDLDDIQFINDTVTWSKLGYNISISSSSAIGVSWTNCTADKCSTSYQCATGANGMTIANANITNCVATNAYVWDYPPGDLFHSDGIHFFTSGNTGVFTSVKIIRYTALTAWGAHTTSPLFLEGSYSHIVVAECLLGSTDSKAEGVIDIAASNPGGTDALIYNNTLKGLASDNTGGQLLYLQWNLWTSVTVKNNIFYNGYTGVALYDSQAVSALHFDYNDYFSVGNIGTQLNSPTPPGSGDQDGSYGDLATWASHLGSKGDEAHGKTVDPVFVGSGNYALQASSTLIDAGSTIGSPYNIDLVSTARPQGAGYDFGALEYIAGADTTPPIPSPSTISSTTVLGSTSFSVTATTATDAGSPPVLYRFSRDNGVTWTAYQSGATYTFTGLAASTLYPTKVQAEDSAATPNVTTASAATNVTTSSGAQDTIGRSSVSLRYPRSFPSVRH